MTNVKNTQISIKGGFLYKQEASWPQEIAWHVKAQPVLPYKLKTIGLNLEHCSDAQSGVALYGEFTPAIVHRLLCRLRTLPTNGSCFDEIGYIDTVAKNSLPYIDKINLKLGSYYNALSMIKNGREARAFAFGHGDINICNVLSVDGIYTLIDPRKPIAKYTCEFEMGKAIYGAGAWAILASKLEQNKQLVQDWYSNWVSVWVNDARPVECAWAIICTLNMPKFFQGAQHKDALDLTNLMITTLAKRLADY